MKRIFSTLLSRSLVLACLSSAFVSCDAIYDDDLPPCTTETRLLFRYDYNMKYADAFPAEVNSLRIWAFDKQGRPVWSDTRSGAELQEKEFYITVPLEPGTYDFVAWCGLDGNEESFSLLNPSPADISDLSVDMLLKGGSRADDTPSLFSDAKFSGLYHVLRKDVVISRNPDANETHEVELSLTKDTNYIKVLLQNLDGSEMKKDDFSIFITADQAGFSHDNMVKQAPEVFRYEPWLVTSGATSLPEGETSSEGTQTSVSSVLAELSTSRLMADARSYLTVVRNSDNQTIIRVPFIQYLLLVKGNYRPMADQEYLDRQDGYSLTFFIDKNYNWYSKIGIYINSWHVVPQQDTPLQ